MTKVEAACVADCIAALASLRKALQDTEPRFAKMAADLRALAKTIPVPDDSGESK